MPAVSQRPATILVVDDVAANIGALSRALESAGHRVLAALSGGAALKSAAKARPDLILLDLLMPEMDGLETCRRLKSDPATVGIPVIFITANHETPSLVGGFQAGAVDYIPKPFRVDEVLARVDTHLHLHRVTRELAARTGELESANATLRAEIKRREQAEEKLRLADDKLTLLTEAEARDWGLAGFVGNSPAFGRLLRTIRSVQAYPKTNVLLTGESGTGKELIARAIHYGGPHGKAPFVAMNCSALPAELAESHLFGHVRGSFTGAIADRRGYFELAHGGTLFLDEIGDMPPALQAKLLRVLEDGEVVPVGSGAGRRVDVRVVAATNVNLPAKVAEGAFRQDLYYRLMHYHVEVPALRERIEDVPLLAAHFIRMFANELKRRPPALRTDAVDRLLAHRYPGNIRELKNTIERAMIHAGEGELRGDHIVFAPQAVAGGSLPPTTTGAGTNDGAGG
ncbi:MAG: sigma-54 dependent transcriptional regulator, partial [Verrucomicrobiota bacterium]